MSSKWAEYVEKFVTASIFLACLPANRWGRIHYSERYSDDLYEYRHVILPKPLLKMIPKNFFEDPQHPEVLRLLDENEWRGIGITQSLGWEHYEVHGERY